VVIVVTIIPARNNTSLVATKEKSHSPGSTCDAEALLSLPSWRKGKSGVIEEEEQRGS
jgi:hypothetical protein